MPVPPAQFLTRLERATIDCLREIDRRLGGRHLAGESCPGASRSLPRARSTRPPGSARTAIARADAAAANPAAPATAAAAMATARTAARAASAAARTQAAAATIAAARTRARARARALP